MCPISSSFGFSIPYSKYVLSSASKRSLVFQKPVVGALDSRSQFHIVFPPQPVQFAHVQELARGAVRFGQVLHDLTGEPHDVLDKLRQFADGHVFPCAHVDDFRFVVGLHQVHAGGGQVVHVQEFPLGGARAPHHHFLGFRGLGLVELPDQGGHHVGGIQVEVVAGAVEVGGRQGDGVESMLAMVGLAHLDAGDLGDGVELVGGLQSTGQEVFLLDGLRAELGVDAGTAQEQELFHTPVEGSVDDVVLHHQVGPDEVHGVGAVGQDPANLGGGHEHILGLLFQEELQHRALVFQVGLLTRPHDDVGEPLRQEVAHDGAAHEPVVPRDEDVAVLVQFQTSCRTFSRRASARSFSTISLAICSTVILGTHPSFCFAFSGLPSRVSTSVGRK